MTVRALVCPSCGAPLPEHAWKMRVTCSYCHAAVTIDRVRVDAADLRQIERRTKEEADKRTQGDSVERVSIAGVTYFLRGRIARGDSADVFWAERTWPRSLALVKVLRSNDDGDRFAHEGEVLHRLADALRESPGMARRVPRLVHRGDLTSANVTARPAMVLRYSSGFVHTFDDVRMVHGDALDPRHLVWMWRRVLELLSAIHSRGVVHGALTPSHFLVHARDHGVNVVGFSSGGGFGALRTHTTDALNLLAPEASLLAQPITSVVDLAMSARAILTLITPDRIPAPLRELLQSVAHAERDDIDAASVERDLMSRARVLYGPASYEKLIMPGLELRLFLTVQKDK